MRQIYLLLFHLVFIIFCSGQNSVESAIKDKSGNLWFNIQNHGVYRYDGASFVNFAKENGVPKDLVSCIYEDKQGDLWFVTSRGLCRYNGKTFTDFSIPLPDSSNVHPRKYALLCETQSPVIRILEDKTGNFWFLTANHGVYRFDGKNFTNFLLEETLQCMEEDKNGTVLVGSWAGGGVYRYDGKAFVHFSGFHDGMIFCMLKDKAGNVWVGTRDNGVDCYDGKSITNLSVKDGLTNPNVSSVFEDSKGNLWFGSDFSRVRLTRGDAFCYDGKSITNVTGKERSIKFADYNVRTIIEDNAGTIWLGSRDRVLLRYDGRSFVDLSTELLK